MINILFVAPYYKCKNFAEETLENYQDKEVQIHIIYAVGVKFIEQQSFNYDVIIARGVTASALKRLYPDTPFVDLPITGFDIVKAIHHCKQQFHSRKIAVIGSGTMIYDVESLADALEVEVCCFAVEQEEDATRLIREIRQEEFEAVISGAMTVEIATRQNVNVVLIESGQEAIIRAVEEAVRIAKVAKQNQTVTERIKAIMDFAYEGIVAVDETGQITVFNRTAEKLANIQAKTALGKHIRTILPQTGLLRVLATGQAELGYLQDLNGVMVAKNRIPVKVKDKVVGAVATFQNVVELQELEGRIREKIYRKGLVAKYSFPDIIGSSRILQATIDMTRKFSEVDSNILLIGETGTGKELLAQSCHNNSQRRSGPFLAVNCAALTENLLESELFGYVEGAFTGAAKGGKPGVFELAHRGTIFLDEVSEIPLKLQGRLLRVLQEREIMRLGHDRIIPVDVRVISASNKDIKELAAAGKFRKDLLYRLDVLHINMPSLRERSEDIPALTEYFLAGYNTKFSKCIQSFNPEAFALLLSYSWPGNIRELKNVCERLAVLVDGEMVRTEDVLKVIGFETTAIAEFDQSCNRHKLRQQLTAQAIERALKQTNGNKTQAAGILGISRTTLWRKLAEYQK